MKGRCLIVKSRITEQQKQFVFEYLKLRKSNITQAAINAGYSPRTASSQGSQLLKNPKVSEFLKSEESKLSQGLRQEFVFDAIEARNVMYKIMKNAYSKDSDKLSAAKDFLDRAGFKAPDKVELTGRIEATGKLNSILEQLKE